MASYTLCFLLLVIFASGLEAQQIRQSNISLSSSLSPTTNPLWLSPSGLYAFGFYQQGQGYKVGIFLAGIQQRTVVWTAERDNPPVAENSTVLFTTDGRLVLRSQGGFEATITIFGEPASSASLTDSGNFLLRSASGDIIWQSFEHPTDTLVPGQRLSQGNELFSSISPTDPFTGIFRLKMQLDGNLVQYPVETSDTGPYAYFTTWTSSRGPNVSLNFDQDGHLYLSNTTGFNIRSITPGGYPLEDTLYRFRLDSDGLLRLYSYDLKQNSSWSVPWISSTDECTPMGLCGINGFCAPKNQEADCRCLPGFRFVQNGNWAAGCERNFTANACTSEAGGIDPEDYIMESVHGMSCEDSPYSSQSMGNKEGCEAACLEDCNCQAALFTDGTCRKQRLPVRYGRIMPNQSTIALIKVLKESPRKTNVSSTPTSKGSRKKWRASVVIVFISIAVAGTITGLVCLGVRSRCGWKWRESTNDSSLEDKEGDENFLDDLPGMPTRFSYSDLSRATENFSKKIGQGGFGSVYLGVLPDGTQLAIKKLEGIGQGTKEFRAEVSTVGSIHHLHLVRLKGFCAEGPHRLLVYEYMPNGSLDQWIFKNSEGGAPFLDWNLRFHIALGIAKGMAYLHEECEGKIVHCDIKPHNVLLDGNFVAKLSDFGLAKLMNREESLVYTTLRGTRGYLAPEWIRNNPISEKSDVYSYGMVLLEILSGRKNYKHGECSEKAHFPSYAFKMLEEGKVREIVDPRMEFDESDERVRTAVKVALWCIQEEMNLRPSMTNVVQMLEGLGNVPEPPLSESRSGDGAPDGQIEMSSTELLSAVSLSGPR